MTIPNVKAMLEQMDSVFLASGLLLAPIAWETIVETVDIIAEGTRNKKEMIFSTIPTAADTSTPP